MSKSCENSKYLMAAGQLLVQFPAARGPSTSCGSGRPVGVSITWHLAAQDTSEDKVPEVASDRGC